LERMGWITLLQTRSRDFQESLLYEMHWEMRRSCDIAKRLPLFAVRESVLPPMNLFLVAIVVWILLWAAPRCQHQMVKRYGLYGPEWSKCRH
jgi:hypothetical protein